MPAQRDFAIRFGWGEPAVRAFAVECPVLVIVDVLSFSTTVDIAVSAGATILPCRLRDDSASTFAAEHRATLAVDRGAETSDRPFSLSPLSMEAAQAGDRIVLPSPNGATLCVAAAGGGSRVMTGCLRNASAVAAVAGATAGPVAVVAAGERWPDGSLRPAVEDLLGAGAVIAALPGSTGRSPEAAAAVAAFRDAEADLEGRLAASVSGRELRDRGFAGDVTAAAGPDESVTVPELVGGEIRTA